MEKEFVTYEQAVALNGLGFCSTPIGGHQQGSVFYFENGKLYYDYRPIYSSTAHLGQIIAPLKQQAIRWFREKFNFFGLVEGGYDNGKNLFTYVIWKVSFDNCIDEYWDTYEEAESACIDKLIELAKQQKNHGK